MPAAVNGRVDELLDRGSHGLSPRLWERLGIRVALRIAGRRAAASWAGGVASSEPIGGSRWLLALAATAWSTKARTVPAKILLHLATRALPSAPSRLPGLPAQCLRSPRLARPNSARTTTTTPGRRASPESGLRYFFTCFGPAYRPNSTFASNSLPTRLPTATSTLDSLPTAAPEPRIPPKALPVRDIPLASPLKTPSCSYGYQPGVGGDPLPWYVTSTVSSLVQRALLTSVQTRTPARARSSSSHRPPKPTL